MCEIIHTICRVVCSQAWNKNSNIVCKLNSQRENNYCLRPREDDEANHLPHQFLFISLRRGMQFSIPFPGFVFFSSVDQDVPIPLTCIYSHESGSGYRAVTCESNSELVTGRVLSSQYVHTTRQLELLMGSCRPIVYLCEQK